MRAQASSEFFMILVALLMIYTFMIVLYGNWVVNLQHTKSRLGSLDASNKVAFAINFAQLAGNGTEYNFSMRSPGSNITIRNNIVEANSTGAAALSQFEILTNRTNFTNIRNVGKVNITNNGGLIEIR